MAIDADGPPIEMTTTHASSATPEIEPVVAEPDPNDALHTSADRYLGLGAATAGTGLLGPVGLVLMAIGQLKLRRGRRAGIPVRNWIITMVGVCCMSDAALNFIGWSADLFAHDTGVVQTFIMGYGRLFDGGYYLGYNSTHVGGISPDGEKVLQVGSCLFLFPVRMVAAWAFIKMKRWGLQVMIMTSWAYLFFWIMYVTNLSLDFDARFGHSTYGFVGWWVCNVVYFTPLLMLPYLYSLNADEWNR